MATAAGKKQIMTYKAHRAASGEGSERIKEMLRAGDKMGLGGSTPAMGCRGCLCLTAACAAQLIKGTLREEAGPGSVHTCG